MSRHSPYPSRAYSTTGGGGGAFFSKKAEKIYVISVKKETNRIVR